MKAEFIVAIALTAGSVAAHSAQHETSQKGKQADPRFLPANNQQTTRTSKQRLKYRKVCLAKKFNKNQNAAKKGLALTASSTKDSVLKSKESDSHTQRRKHTWLERITVVFAGLAFCASAWLGLVMRDQEHRQLRAQVGIESLEINAPNLMSAQYQLVPNSNGAVLFTDFIVGHLHNYGQTPAFNVSFFLMAAVGPELFASLPPAFPYIVEHWQPGPLIPSFVSRAIVEPGQSVPSKIGISGERMAAIRKAETKSAYVYFYGAGGVLAG